MLRFLVLTVLCLQTWAIYEAKQAAAEIEMTHDGVKQQLTPGW